MSEVSSKVAHIEPDSKTPDMRVANLADRQHRVVSVEQLRRLGLKRGAIRYRLKCGRLHHIHDGVYAVGSRDLTRNGFLIAAVFACGKGALLSHKTAADHLGLIQTSSRVIHVTVPGRNKPQTEGITVHLSRQLAEADRTEHEGIPVTSVARTLVDLAGTIGQTELIKAIEQAERLRIFDMRAVEHILERSAGRGGAAALRKALIELAGDPPDLRSKLEERFRDYCQLRGLSLPSFNVSIAGFCVDGIWPEHNVVLELDSRRHHTGIGAFEEDRKRDTKLQIAGHRIIRVTDKRMKTDPDGLEQDLRSLLR